MANNVRMYALRDFGSEQGHHAGDLFVEVFEATLVAGTIEVPTKFKDGNILVVFVMRNDDATVGNGQVFTSDRVVTSGAVTVSGPTGATSKVAGIIIGRLEV